MTRDEAIELAKLFAEKLGEGSRALVILGLALIAFLCKDDLTAISSVLWYAGALLICTLGIDFAHGLVGVTWAGKIAFQLGRGEIQKYDGRKLFSVLYGFLFAKCFVLIAGYVLLLMGLYEATTNLGSVRTGLGWPNDA